MTDTITTPVDEDIKDFTVARKPIRFRIDDDFFTAAPALPADRLLQFAKLADAIDPKNLEMQPFHDLFSMVLRSESAEVFIDRLSNPDNPIDFEQLNGVMVWLMEQYGLRPTEPSSDSSTTSPTPDDGTNSTVAPIVMESTSLPYQQTPSSTSSTST